MRVPGKKRLRENVQRWLKSTSQDPAGRRMLKAIKVGLYPWEYWRRKIAARNLLSGRTVGLHIDPETAYRRFDASEIPAIPALVDLCRDIYADKAKRIEELRSSGNDKARFLTELLDDQDLVRYPQLVDFALSDALLDAASEYLGSLPVLRRVGLQVSMRDAGEPRSSMLFHRDPEDYRQVKLFVNIFDVDEACGPFSFIPADLSEQYFRSISPKGGNHWRRFSDAEVFEHCGAEKMIQAIGGAGSAVMADTSRCLHFGSRVHDDRFRLVYMASFGTYHQLRWSPANYFDSSRFQGDPVRHQVLTEEGRDRGFA